MSTTHPTLDELAAAINAREHTPKASAQVRRGQKQPKRRCGGLELGADYHTALKRCKNVDIFRCRREGCEAIYAGTPGTRYCSPKCQKLAEREQVQASNRRIAIRRRVRRSRVCERCGEPMDSERSTKRFCSARCRVAAYRGKT